MLLYSTVYLSFPLQRVSYQSITPCTRVSSFSERQHGMQRKERAVWRLASGDRKVKRSSFSASPALG